MDARGRRRAATRRCALALLAGALLRCLHPAPGPECSGAGIDLDALRDETLRVRVLLFRDGEAQRHEVVVRTRPGRVEAIGLTPVGTQAFRVSHDRAGIEVENRIGRHLSLSPRLAYDAIARTYLASAAARPGEAHLARAECGYEARLLLVSEQEATL